MVTLQPITLKNIFAVQRMKADPSLVAPNNFSLAEAFAYRSEHKQDPIAYAIYYNDTPVGFIMAVYNPPESFLDCVDNNGQPFYYLWRNMIDENHQKKGYGRAALELLIAEAKAGKHGVANAFYTSTARQSKVTPKFYGSLGFVYTGEVDKDYADESNDEDIMRLAL